MQAAGLTFLYPACQITENTKENLDSWKLRQNKRGVTERRDEIQQST